MQLSNNILTLRKNTLGRDFVVGDIHGQVDKLKAQLAEINFDQAIDRLICTGDLIDRGPQSPEALALLDEPWFFSVLGNHEYLLYNVLKLGNSKYKISWAATRR